MQQQAQQSDSGRYKTGSGRWMHGVELRLYLDEKSGSDEVPEQDSEAEENDETVQI